ncbi:uncharacterized protein LOC127465999 isoform X4 [Manacus candei]|uniref:uncharacterized protein LOC127465999 isoform X4 n=1 Tax=Manacus candei TaxID=415023 RepID=UPI002226892F|nr:uncharacterized protein LOC127465999 isoform X4 [Manacus candei]
MSRSWAGFSAWGISELGRFQRPGEPGSEGDIPEPRGSRAGMGGILSKALFPEMTRTVTVKVSNRTRDITLDYPRKLCSLKNVYEEMAGREPKLLTKGSNFERVALDICQDSIWKTQGPLDVMATMLNARHATVSVAVRGFK